MSLLRRAVGSVVAAESNEPPNDEQLLKMIRDKGVDQGMVDYILGERFSLDAIYQALNGTYTVDQVAKSIGYTGTVKGGETKKEPEAQSAQGAKSADTDTRERERERERQRSQSRQGKKQRQQGTDQRGRYWLYQLFTAPRAPEGWWDDFWIDYLLLTLSRLLWTANGYFTVTGVAILFRDNIPGRILGITLGVLLHLLISRLEYRMWSAWRGWLYLILGSLALAVDTVTTANGLMVFTRNVMAGALTEGLPTSIAQWSELPAALWGNVVAILSAGEQITWVALPDWWFRGLVYILVAVTIAVTSERAVRRFQKEYQATMAWRFARA